MDNFFNLTPDRVLSAVEAQGYQSTGRYRFLNSYENRVFDIELEVSSSLTPTPPLTSPIESSSTSSIIAKFYRPNRWSKDCILEEHQFLWELQEEGLPVAAPLKLENQTSLFQLDFHHNHSLNSYPNPHQNQQIENPNDFKNDFKMDDEPLYMALFPKVRGRMLEEILPPQVPHLGRWLARLHNVGARKPTQFRPHLEPNIERLKWIEPHIPIELWPEYRNLAEEVFEYLNSILNDFDYIRVHGDFHRGNLLWNDNWTLIDFDDFMMAPAAQDFWIILSQLESEAQQNFVDAYLELRDWDPKEEQLLEPLRAYRIIHYSTWIGERWQDPSFPNLFPNFREFNFWSNEILSLKKIFHDNIDI